MLLLREADLCGKRGRKGDTPLLLPHSVALHINRAAGGKEAELREIRSFLSSEMASDQIDLLKAGTNQKGNVSSGLSWGFLRHFPKDPWLAT